MAENANISGTPFRPLKMLEFLGGQFLVFGPILFGCLLVMIWRWRSITADPRQALLMAFTVPLLAIMTGQSLLAGANLNWAVAAYAAAFIAVVAQLRLEHRRRLLVGAVAAHVAILAVITAFEPVARATGIVEQAGTDPFRRLRGWDAVGTEIGDLVQQTGEPLAIVADRAVHAAALFYGPLDPARTFAWNGHGLVGSHFELVNNARDQVGADFLVFSIFEPALLAEHFDHVEERDPIVVPTHADRDIRVRVWWAEGFAGYEQPTASP